MRWPLAILVVAVVVGLLLATLLPESSVLPGGSMATDPPTPSDPAVSSPTSPTPEATHAQAIEPASYVGPPYDLNVLSSPTEFTNQAKLWFNDGAWWGLLVSELTHHVSIHELNWVSQRWIDTGVVVDERSFVRLDALWDGTSLYVVGSGSRMSSSNAVRTSRFSYDAEIRRYLLQPDFPRTLTAGGVGAPTLAEGTDGRLWIAYIQSRRPYVRYSTTDGLTWSTGFRLPVQQAEVPADVTAIVGTNRGVAVAWTSLHENALHVAEHVDGEPDDAWTVHSVDVDGLTYGDDQISVRSAADGSILVALRTSLDRVNNRILDAPQLVLSRLHGVEWDLAVVGRVRDGHSGPQVLVDDARAQVYVFAEAAGGIYVKRADLAELTFATGRGILAIRAGNELSNAPTPSPTDTAESPGIVEAAPSMSNVSSTKQDLDGVSEIVVIASDDVSGRYGHAVMGLPGGRDAPDADGHLGPLPAGVTEGLPPGATTFLFRNSFSPFSPGPASITGWRTNDEPADQLVTVSEPTEGDPSLRLVPNESGEGPRACKQFASSATGVIIVGATVQARGAPESDATITTLRWAAGEIASVRFGEPGTFRYFVGDERITSEVPYQPGAWYRSVLTLDLGSQAYDWRVSLLGTETPVLALNDQPLRVPAIRVGEVCMQSADEVRGGNVELLVDDVSVEIGPGT